MSKVWELEKYTKLNTIFCLIKSSGIVFIFLPAFYLAFYMVYDIKKSIFKKSKKMLLAI